MGEFSKWLLHEDRKELFEYLYANALMLVFLGLTALLLWPLGKVSAALALAKGFWVFWIVLIQTAVLLALFQRVFRVDLYDKYNTYVISGLVVGGVVQLGWSAYAALTARGAADGAGLGVGVALYAVGFVSCFVACACVSAFYTGAIYRYVNLPLAFAGFVLFSLWPAAARFLFGWFFEISFYGWFFDLF